MEITINNLRALIEGKELNLYQRSLAVEEWHNLLTHVDDMEKVLRQPPVARRSEKVFSKENKLDCPYDFTSRCTMGNCDCKPIASKP